MIKDFKELSTRARSALKKANISTVEELSKCSLGEMIRIPGCGVQTAKEFLTLLHSKNLSFHKHIYGITGSKAFLCEHERHVNGIRRDWCPGCYNHPPIVTTFEEKSDVRTLYDSL